MKELTIEQKAQRYDEAIEKARHYHSEMGSDVCCVLEECFSELKESQESEDERIRKNCIHFLELQKQHHAATFEIEECISWLEKQGEQTYVKWSYDEGKQIQINPSEYINDMGGNGCYLKNPEQDSTWSEEDEKMLSDINNCIKNLPIFYESININGEDKTTEWFVCNAINWLKLLKDKVRQKKQEWSDDDKEQLGRAIYMMEQLDMIKSWSDVYNWLKSIEDRVLPHPRQDWSEEDEESILEICNYLDRIVREDEDNQATLLNVKELKDWLKSIRPQPQWKPSDEQINTLEQWLKDNQYKGDARYCYPIFESLYKDILSFLNTIKVKGVDLDKEINEHWDDWAKEDGFHFIDFAKYFYELGLKTQKEE